MFVAGPRFMADLLARQSERFHQGCPRRSFRWSVAQPGCRMDRFPLPIPPGPSLHLRPMMHGRYESIHPGGRRAHSCRVGGHSATGRSRSMPRVFHNGSNGAPSRIRFAVSPALYRAHGTACACCVPTTRPSHIAGTRPSTVDREPLTGGNRQQSPQCADALRRHGPGGSLSDRCGHQPRQLRWANVQHAGRGHQHRQPHPYQGGWLGGFGVCGDIQQRAPFAAGRAGLLDRHRVNPGPGRVGPSVERPAGGGSLGAKSRPELSRRRPGG